MEDNNFNDLKKEVQELKKIVEELKRFVEKHRHDGHGYAIE